MKRPAPPAAWPSPDLVRDLQRDLDGRAAGAALVLGSGLGGIADALTSRWSRDVSAIPGYPRSTVAGHQGRLLWGNLEGTPVWIAQGRVHLYEGYTPEEVTRPVRLLHALGARTLVLTNAAGSLDPLIPPGDLVVAADALSLYFRMLARPEEGGVGRTLPGAWQRRVPLTDPALFRLAQEVARAERIPLRTGVLVASLGPNYETAAEVAAWRRLGGTVATMSTVPEAVQARELNLRCVIFSLVTNHATGLSRTPLDHDEVMARAGEASRLLGRLLGAMLPLL